MPLIASVGLGIIKFGAGAAQSAAAKKTAKNIHLNQYDIPDGYEENVRMMQNQSQYGLDPFALNFASQMGQRGLTASIDAGLQSGANPNNITDYYSAYLNSLGKLSINDSEARWQKINALAKAKEEFANQEAIKFGYDEGLKKDKLKAAQQQAAQGFQNQMGGLDMLGNAAANWQSQTLQDKQIAGQDAYLNGLRGIFNPAPTAPAPGANNVGFTGGPNYGNYINGSPRHNNYLNQYGGFNWN